MLRIGRFERFDATRTGYFPVSNWESSAKVSVDTLLRHHGRYKPSGECWLGDIPRHWDVVRLKGVAANIVDITREVNRSDIYLALENVESWTGRISTTDGHTASDGPMKRFRDGDVLFGRLRPYLAKVTCSGRSGVCVGEFLVLRRIVAKLSPRFLEYLMRSKPAIDAIDASTFGARMPRADWQFIGDVRIPLPSFAEQAAIVRYLDDMNRRVRRYVRAKERLIGLLDEEKQAIINQAVTRGLDPSVRLKASGVEWLGDVPEHWEVSRVKSGFLSLNRRRRPLSAVERGAMTQRRYDYYGASGVIDKVEDYLFDDQLLLIAEDGANLVLRNLPLAIIARGRFWVNNHAHILKPRRGNLEYLAAVMESLNYSPWISGAAQPKLTQDRLMSIAIAVPPRQEQDAIIADTRARTEGLTAGIVRDRRQIELLEEYRTRLIADVVTGKLDVREAAAGLPDEADDDLRDADGLV